MDTERMMGLTEEFSSLSAEEKKNAIKVNFNDIWEQASLEVPELIKATRSLKMFFLEYGLANVEKFTCYAYKNEEFFLDICLDVDRSFDIIALKHKDKRTQLICKETNQLFETIKESQQEQTQYTLRYAFKGKRVVLVVFRSAEPLKDKEEIKKLCTLMKKDPEFSAIVKKLEVEMVFNAQKKEQLADTLDDWLSFKENQMKEYMLIWEKLLAKEISHFKKEMKKLSLEQVLEPWLIQKKSVRYFKSGKAYNVKKWK